jgi:ABC-type bacteriocin/lantibiotic exporter with double-glycine peptidase domain
VSGGTTQDGPSTPATESLRATSLSFRHADASRPVLRDLTFTLPTQGCALVRGGNGTGKSTLLKVLAGLYSDYQGSVTVGGREVRTVAEAERARHVLYVSEEPLLVSGTVRENLTLGAPHAQEDIDRACRIACFDEVVDRLTGGYEAHLREDGGRLSRGQAQRLAVARAVLLDPAIILFDETFSGIDEDTFRRVWKNLRETPGTKVLVSHREVPEADFDVIITLGD